MYFVQGLILLSLTALEPNMLIPLQAQCDLQHLWCGRRASVRIRQELMASIYDKALKRKDLSGIVHKDQEEGKGKGTISNYMGVLDFIELSLFQAKKRARKALRVMILNPVLTLGRLSTL